MRFEVVGRHKIVRELGKGAMGEVYLGYDPDLDREVAIKTIIYDPGTPDAELKEAKLRFLREAKVAAKLSHPNIVIIYDVGEFETVPYISMEFVRGETLDQYIKPTSLLPLPRVVEIIAQVADALDYAHRHDLVHRDIKPSNVMISQSGSVKVMDFGLAKKPTANLTQAGLLLGTPSYMAPEQIKGEALDGRADLFALGVVLYQMLTGEKPFKGETISTIMYKILNEDPPAPTILNSKLPPQFDSIIRKALAKIPAERFQTGREMKMALEDYLNFTSRMSRIKLHAPARAAEGESTAAIQSAQVPIGGPPLTSASAPARRGSLKKVAVWAAILLGTAGVAAAGYAPVKSWVREKSMDMEFPLPAFLITWANDGKNPRLEVATIALFSEEGTEFYMNGSRLPAPSVVVPIHGEEVHEVLARKDCYETLYRISPEDIERKTAKIQLKEAEVDVRISSAPAGASVFYRRTMGGKAQGDFEQAPGVTPMTLRLGACTPYNFRIAKEGFTEKSDHQAIKQGMVNEFSYELAELPKPVLTRFEKGPYPYEVWYEGKKVAEGGKEVSLYPRTYQFEYINKKIFLHKYNEFTVQEGAGKTAVKPSLPSPGTVSVLCFTNATIFVDDTPLGAAPVRDHGIVSGNHRLRAEVREPGQPDRVVQQAFEVHAGKLTYILITADEVKVSFQ
jgi:serine/threonine-protein kinase